jgi:uncharacterized repeat protein (TIGR01451 family)
MFFHFLTWLRGKKSGRRRRKAGPTRTTVRRAGSSLRRVLEALESRVTPTLSTFASGSYIIDMGQATQTIGNALKPYGLVYDLVTNYKVPVNWAINPSKTTFRLDTGNPVPVDFTATITTGTKSYSGGSFIIDSSFLTPSVIADINSWKSKGVVVDQLAASLTTDIYGAVTSFPRAVLDAANGTIAVPYYTNAGIPSSSYILGNPTNLTMCDDVYILTHADVSSWPASWQQALYNFVSNIGGGLWAACHSVSELEDTVVGGSPMDFLSNGLVPFGSHGSGTPPYSYNPAAANDPIMQIMNRLDSATLSGSEQIYVPTSSDWRSTTTVAVYDPDHPNNPPGGTSPYNDAAVIAYGNAFGDPSKGMVMYEAGHTLTGGSLSAQIAAQRAFFNFILLEGILRAPKPIVTFPTVTAGQTTTITASITGGDGTYTYQWISSSGGAFSKPAGTWTIGDPPLTTQYLLTKATDTIRLLVTDACGRQGINSFTISDPPPAIDLDADNSSGATGADYKGYFAAGAVVAAADSDTLITDNGTVIHSGVIKLTNRPDGTAETLLINTSLASGYGISVASDGKGGFLLSGTATLAQYQQVIASLQYANSLAFPNTADRVITVTVNDGLSNSNVATSRLSFLGGTVTTVNKQLYLSDPGQGMDRVDPVATGDTTTSSVSVAPVVSPNSTGMATWSNNTNKNLEYRPWLLTGYGTHNTVAVNGGSYVTMASAASPKQNQAVVVGVTSDRHISGAVWNGSTWTPISIKVGATVTQNLGSPSQSQWWGATVAYENTSGRAVLVWNTGSTLNYSIYNGTSWTTAATIPAYTGVEPRQIRLAANPLAGSNEMVLVVTDKNKVDRALVWNGSSWGNQIQLDNNNGHNFTDVNVVYEQQDGRAMVVYASGTTGDVGYRIWNGSSWSAAATLSAPAGSNNYAQWTAVAADPNSNRIVLGVESNGNDTWMNVWDGTAWGTSTLGISNGVTNQNNLNIAVAFESMSGDALAVYQNDLAATELQYKTWNSGTWSAGTNFGALSNQSSRAITLTSNPYSDQIQLLVNDNGKILRSDLWSGTSFAPLIQLETNTNTTNGQPISYFWDHYLPGTVTTSTTFTQTTAMTSPFVMPTGGAAKVTTYIQLLSGSLPAAPKLAATLSQAGNTLLTLAAPPIVTALGGGFYKLVWTGSFSNNVTVPTGGQIALTLTDFDSSYSFNVLYDSATYPSQVQVTTATAITVSSLDVFGSPFPAGSPLTTTAAGAPAYVRFSVSDPFGAADITSADVVIKNSSGGTVLSTSVTDTNVVASTAGSKTYELAWTPPIADTFTITVTAHEGTEGVTATRQTTITATALPDLVVSKSDGGATVSAGGSVAYTINYSNAGLANSTGVVLTEFLPVGSKFNAAASTAGWVALGAGAYRFAVGSLAAGAGGSVVFDVTVPSPVPAGLEQLNNTVQIADDGTHGPDANPLNNTAQDSTPVIAGPDLVITKTDGGTSTVAGGIVLYQIRYSNVGTQNADGVTITETLPANTTFNSTYSFGNWDDEGSGQIAVLIGNLAAGASGMVTFAVEVASPLPAGVTQIFNTVSIADSGDSGPDLNPANNTATDTTPISNNPQADLQITKTNNVSSVQPGSVVTYTITVTNAGPNAVTGAAFTDNVPATMTGVSYTTAVSGGATATPSNGSGNSISGTLNVPVGGMVVYTVTGTLDPNATGTLTNFASILPPTNIVDPNTGNNTAVDSDPIVPVADLSLNKSYTYTDLDGSGTLTPGDQIDFAITVTNKGPNPAYNVTVQDLLPNGYQYVSDDAVINGGTYSQGTGLWTIGSPIGPTAPNNTAVLHIIAIVGAGGTYTNVAEVESSDSADPNSTPGNGVPTEDDYSSVTPPVQPKSDLSLSKTMALTSDLYGTGVLSIGDQVTFTISLNNLGPNDAANVHVADLLPAGYAYFSSTPSQGTYTAATGDWNVGTVGVLTTPTLTIVATVVGNKPASAYTNYAQVSASGSFDPNSTPNNNSTTEDDNASVTPMIADLSVTKTAALSPGGDLDGSGNLTVGDQVDFTVTVANAGPDFASGVQLTDLLANGYTYQGDDSPGTYDPVTGIWNVGVIAPGATATLTITVTVNAAGSYANTAQVTASQQFDPDSTPNNNVPTEDDQATITLTPGVAAQAPVAVNDSSLHNSAGPVTLNVTANDTDANLDLNVATVDLNPVLAGQQTTLTVPGQGTWTVDAAGNVTFTPQAGFTLDPTPINYTVQDSGGLISNQASITIDYVPVASDDSSTGNTTGTAVTVNVLANDTTGDTPVPSTVQIVGTPGPGVSLAVPGQGAWSVNTTTGAITFTPAAGYTGDPTPIQYTVQDNDGNTSNAATVTIDYVQFPPVAVNDSSLNNPPGQVTLNVTANDTDPNNDLDPSTVDLDPATAGRQTMRAVASEGLWQVDSAGNVTFIPNVGFAANPTSITYTVADKTGLVSNAATITITYVPQADLQITKTDNSATAVPGTSTTYTIVVTNAGPRDVTGATVQDTFPANLTGVTWTASATGGATGFTANGSGGAINDTVNMPAGSRITYIVTGAVSAAATGSLSNTATVTAPAGVTDPDTSNNVATDTDTLTPQADLALTKTIDNPTPNVGDNVTFTVTLTNHGPSDATGVQVNDLLPTGLTFVSDTTSQGSYDSATGLWNVGTVTNGSSKTLTLTARVDLPQPLTNTATISHSDPFDPDGSNNSASASEAAQQADLQVQKTVDNSRPNVGDVITFTITLTNGGPNAASNVRVTDLLPAGLGLVSTATSLGTYDSASGLWNVGTMANAAVAVLTIRAQVNVASARTNMASVSHADQYDPTLGNNTASVTETPQQADLVLTKSVNNPTPNVGDTVTFTITLADASSDAATNVQVNDALPAGLTFVSATPSQGNYNSATGVWSVGTVTSATPQTLLILATVVSPAARTNMASIGHSDQFDPNTGNNTAAATETPQQADLQVTKVVDNTAPNVGDTITYTITLTNIGPDAATNVSLRDVLPAGLSYASSNPSQGSYDSTSGTWTVGTVGSGATQTLKISALVTSASPAVNTASISHADQYDPNLANNSDTASTIPQEADLSLSKAVNNPTPNVGDTVIYTVTLTNVGPSAATGVKVNDLLPAGLSLVGANPSQGTYIGGVWSVGSLANGSQATLTLSATVVSSTAQTNTATISHSDQYDSNPGNNTASAVETPQQADLRLQKAVDNSRPNVGDVITFTVTLTNAGPDAANNVRVSDLLPAGLGLVSTTPSQGTYDSATGLWNVGTMANAAIAFLTIRAQVNVPAALSNTASVSRADQYDPVTGNNIASVTETPQQADLAVGKSVSNPTPNVGDTVTYTLTVTNNGPDAATGVTLQDVLPAGVGFQSFSASVGSYDPVTRTWTVGTVANGATETLTIAALVTSPNPQANTASISHADQYDPDTANNSHTASINPQQADLLVTKSVSDATPNVGDTITYTVRVTNTGPSTATGVHVNDLLPAGLTFASATPSQGTYTAGSGVWNVGTVATGTTAVLTIQAKVASSTAQTNTATAAADQFDPTPGNDTASITETPQQADLVLNKTVNDPTPNVGDTITFTLTLNDLGPDSATNARVNDLLPAGLTYVSATPSQGTYDNTTGVWNVGTVTPGFARTLLLNARVTAAGARTNTATVGHSDQFDPVTSNNTASATETPQRSDLRLTKTVDQPRPNVGDVVTFTVTLSNAGPDTATGVAVADLLPAGLGLVSASPSQGTYDSTGGQWTVGSVNVGVPATLTLRAQVLSASPATNVATITHADQFDPDTTNNTGSATETPQQADLRLTKSVDQNHPNVGDAITYTVTLSNAGPDAATGVSISDVLPGGLSFLSATPSQGSYDAAAGTWTVGAVANGATQTLQIQARVVSPVSQTNTAMVSGADQFDPNTGNNTASVTETPQQSDLALTKVVNNPTPNVGDIVTFTITLTDASSDAATNVQVNDALPAGLAFVSATPSQGNYDNSTGVWSVGTVTSATPQTLLIQAKVTSPVAQTNAASVGHSDQFDPNTGNNTAAATETPQQADLQVTKVVDNIAPNVGDTITYTITLSNNGPDAATNVSLQDVLPAGASYVSSNPSQGSYDSTTGLWTVGTVGSGATRTLTIAAVVTSPNPQANTASVSHSDQFDPNPANNSDTTSTDPQEADLSLSKVVSNPTPNVGDTITYMITLTNTGPNDATNVNVTDLLPAGLTLVAANPSQGTYIGGVWSAGSLANGSQATLTLSATVVSPTPQTNTATISHSDQFDSNPGSNTASAVETPQQADLQVTKSVSNPTPNVGDTVTFTVTVSNAGPDSATNVQLNDLLPAGLTFLSATSSQGAYDSSTGSWTIGTVSTAAAQTLQIVARVVSPTAVTNTATISHSDQYDPNGGNNSASATETPQQADLGLTKSVSNASPNVGDTITYTVNLTNNGPNTATGVTVADLLPAGLGFLSASTTTGSYDNATGLWTVGTLANGSVGVLTISARVVSQNAQTNVASVSHGDQFDPDSTNNSASATETPRQAELKLTKAVSNATPNVGDTITFTVTLANNGPDAATNVTVNDMLPAGLAFVSATAGQGSYVSSTGVWTVGAINAAASTTLQIQARVVSSAARTNIATITHADQFDPATGNNTANATETPQQADLTVTKTVDNTHPMIGDTITFTITLTNRGPDAATNVSLIDLLPAGLAYLSAIPSQGTYNNGSGVWNVGTVASGAAPTLHLSATVLNSAPQTNTATVVAVDQYDPDPSDNVASATASAQTADLSLSKTVNNNRPNVGDVITYTVTLTDQGPDAATNVSVTDRLPAGLTFLSAAPSQGRTTPPPVSGDWGLSRLSARRRWSSGRGLPARTCRPTRPQSRRPINSIPIRTTTRAPLASPRSRLICR